MKPLLSLIVIFAFTGLYAQNDSLSKTKKPKQYVVSVQTMDDKRGQGIFYSINENNLLLQRTAAKKGMKETLSFSAEQLNLVKIHRKNSALRGALIGAGIGLLTGVIAGFAEGDDPVYTEPVYDPFSAIAVGISNAFAMTAGEKAVLYGGLGTITGAGIGAILGAVIKKKFIIGGKKENFNAMRTSVLDKVYGKQKK